MFGSTSFTGRIEGVRSRIPLLSFYINVDQLIVIRDDYIRLTRTSDTLVDLSPSNECLSNYNMLSDVTKPAVISEFQPRSVLGLLLLQWEVGACKTPLLVLLTVQD